MSRSEPRDTTDQSRCAICQWPLKNDFKKGCIKGNCSLRPVPIIPYDYHRAIEDGYVSAEEAGKLWGKCDKSEPSDDLQRELTALFNRYNAENGSGTPNYVLAEYLLGCLEIFNLAVVAREQWYGRATKAGPDE